MIYYENIIFYRDSSHNAVLFIIDSLTLFRDKKIHINNDFIVLFFIVASEAFPLAVTTNIRP